MSIWNEIEEELAGFPGHFDLVVQEPTVTIDGETFTIKNPHRLLEDLQGLPDRAGVEDIMDLLSYF